MLVVRLVLLVVRCSFFLGLSMFNWLSCGVWFMLVSDWFRFSLVYFSIIWVNCCLLIGLVR